MIKLFFRENAQPHLEKLEKLNDVSVIDDEIRSAIVYERLLKALKNKTVIGRKSFLEESLKINKYDTGVGEAKRLDFVKIDNSLSYPHGLTLYDSNGYVKFLTNRIVGKFMPLDEGKSIIQRTFKTYHSDKVNKNEIQGSRFLVFSKFKF